MRKFQIDFYHVIRKNLSLGKRLNDYESQPKSS